MRCVGVVASCLVFAFGGLQAAFAEGQPTLTERIFSRFLSGGAYIPTSLYFSGADLWRKGGTAYGGVVWSPNGLARDGFTLKLLLATGGYLYQSGDFEFRGADIAISALPGYRVKRGNFEIKAFIGLDAQHHWTLPFDPSSHLRGTYLGVRANIDIWWEPLPATVMLTTTLTGSTIGSSYGARGAAGWRVLDSFWFGPEIEMSGDKAYTQYRVGAHITSIKFAGFEWAFGAGYVNDDDDRSGVYGRFNMLKRR